MKQSLHIIQSIVKPSDWLFRSFTPIKYGGQNEQGDWTIYLPEPELQKINNLDRLDCVTFSLLNCLETLYYFQINTKRNFSDRWLAKLSGTTRQGNSMDNVFDTAQQYGLVDEELWPDNPSFTWDEYYSDIPKDIINAGKNFNYDLYREWVNQNNKSDIVKALESSPLQAIVRYASGDGILYPQGELNHAVMLYRAELGQYWEIYDSESLTTKKYHWDYPFGSILKPSLIKKNMFMPEDNLLYCLVQGSSQNLAMGYKGKLMIYDDKFDTDINSAMRSGKRQVPTPLTLENWDSIEHINGKGEKIG